MKKSFIFISYILLTISIILFGIVNFIQVYNFTYSFALMFFILLSSLTFVIGIIKNQKENYKRNIKIYMIMYFVLLFSLTIFISRTKISFDLLNKEYLKYYIESINIIPFKTIIGYLTGNFSTKIILYNIVGNLFALMPLSLLLIIKDKKYENIKYQFIYLVIVVLLIEVLQFVSSTGRFDIDDFILNVIGGLLFLIVIKKVKVTDKIRNLFYTDFNISKLIKYISLLLICIVIIVIDIFIVVGIADANNYQKNTINQSFYVETFDECDEMQKINLDGYNLYINCVNVIYEDELGTQMTIKNALENNYLTRDYIKEKLILKESLKDGGTQIYINKEENISIVLCNTINGNQDIYVGNAMMNYQEHFCN